MFTCWFLESQPTCLKPVTDHSGGHQVRKGVCVSVGGRCLPDAMDRAGGVSEAPRDQVQGAAGDMRRQSGEAESNLEKVL